MKPPRAADRLLAVFCAPHLLEAVQGDLHEEFAFQVERFGERKARWWYWREVLGFLKPFALKRQRNEFNQPLFFHPVMLRNYFNIAWRGLAKNRLYTLTNVLGLTIGLTACGLIALYVYDEYRVDRFHENGHRLYRVVTTTLDGGKTNVAAGSVGRPLAGAIRREVPGVEAVVPVRLSNFSVKHANRYFFDKTLYAGEDFLTAFGFPFLAGDPRTALREPYTLVLTESTARKYFGAAPALGKTLTLADSLTFRVTGVLADPPPSHLDFGVLLSLPTFYALGGDPNQWFTWDEFCYVLLQERADPAAVERTLAALPMKHNGAEYRSSGMHVLQALEPVPGIYLHSKAGGVNLPTGSAKQLYFLGAIGLFLLLLACINFVNLTTAHQSERAKEVGVRKTVGAGVGSLVAQFLGESLLLAFLAGGLALAGVALALPLLNELTQKTIPLSLLARPLTLLAAVGFLGLVGLLAGWYPALVLARFRPVDTLKGRFVGGSDGAWLRRGLVVFQFGISLVLLIGTGVATRQLRFMQEQALGFDKDRVLVVELRKLPRKEFIDTYEAVKAQLKALPNVRAVTGVAALPGRSGWNGQMVYPEGRPKEQALSLEVIPVDHDYVPTLGLKLRAGRGYDPRLATDARHGVLLNEAACQAFGWKPEEAIGKKIATAGMQEGRVLGVLADFHQHGLQQKITPLLTFIAPFAYRFVALRLGPQRLTTSVGQVEKYWKERFPGYEFESFFLDDDFNQQYAAEQRLAKLFGVFATLAIFIACLGLFALATFTTERRVKEIGVRKVLGASVVSIVALLSKDFLKLVFVAIGIASPLAWWAANRWLQDFAYRIAIEWWMFAAAGALAVGIALLTVSFQAVKAALTNPVESLRSE